MVCFVSQKTSRNFIVLLEVIALVMFTACHEKTLQSEIVLIADGDSMYLARVTAPYTETDSRIQVYVFNDSVRETVGSWISRSQMLATREKPLREGGDHDRSHFSIFGMTHGSMRKM